MEVKHSINMEEYGLKLRPVTLEDAEFICSLRNEIENTRYIGDTSNKVEDQKFWIENYLKRANDYYFCIEKLNGESIGTIAIYDINNNRAEWGRWILKDKNLYSPTTVLLIFKVAFEFLNLKTLYCRTVELNTKVVSFHDHVGLRRVDIEYNGVQIKGEYRNLIVHEINKENFEVIKNKLQKLAQFSERFL